MKSLKILLPSLFLSMILTTPGFSQIFYVFDDSLWVQSSNDATPALIAEESGNRFIDAVVADTVKNMVYWSQGAGSSDIYMASLDSLNVVSEIEIHAGMFGTKVNNLSLDPSDGMLYWSDNVNDGYIYRIGIDSENGEPEILIEGDPDGVTDGTLDLDLDLANNKMYWVKYGAVMRANLDGSNIEKVVDIPDNYGPTQPQAMALDIQGGYVYWINSSTDQIERASITDGGQIENIVHTSTASALDIDMKNGRLYWLEDYMYTNDGGAIYSSNLNGTDKQLVMETSEFVGRALFVGEWQIATTNENNMKSELPNNIKLAQNYPNPFNPTTVIEYELPQAMGVNLIIYNFLGQKIKSLINGELQNAGTHKVIFNAENLAGGIYFYQIKTETGQRTQKMTLIK